MVVEDSTSFRTEWAELPRSGRAELERGLGGEVRAAAGQAGGFTHGLAARLVLADGRRAFAKAIPVDDALAGMYRAEAGVAAGLPRSVPAPPLRFTAEIDGWFAMVFDDVAGRHPRLREPADLAAVLATVERLADALTPSPLPGMRAVTDSYGRALSRWQQFAEHGPPPDLDDWSRRNLDLLADLESTWPTHCAGETLLHSDLRPDNMLLGSDGIVCVVDWAAPCRGAAWADLVILAPSIALDGVDPDPILTAHPLTRAVDPAAIDALVCALTGFWTYNSRLPVPPRSPRLRAHQARSGAVTREWLRRRVGWD
ncbi:phosphotransferase [Nocardia wallacei]|uniref:phosphotransferase n=1 Tax=Nocardia wallacei TaxID=480035 RepID=UPI002456CEE3|nr:phosphotransferase [Nocardia wallacei]